VSLGGKPRRTPARRSAAARGQARRSTNAGRDLSPAREHRRTRTQRLRRSRPPSAGAQRGLRLPALTIPGRSVLRLVVLGAEVAGLLLLINQPAFASTQVEVSGAKHLTRQHILDRGGLAEGTSVFLVSTTTAQSQLASDPYIRSVTVRTQLPNQVRVEVTEWDAIAMVSRGQGHYLVNEAGNVLAATTDGSVGGAPGQPHLPITEEADGGLRDGQSALSSRLLSDLDHMQSTFPAAYKLTVGRFIIQAGGQLVVETTAGPRILFGQMVTDEQIDSLDAKLAALKSLSGQVDLGHAGLDYVTLENPSAPATHAIPSPSPSPKPSAAPTRKP
jgi:hypothetical protein